jgi:hypothetical protein
MKQNHSASDSLHVDYSTMTNEKILFILNRSTGLAPYSHEFEHSMHDPNILSGFISAMTSFMEEVTGTTQKNWTTDFGEDTTLIVEGGEWAVAVLAVSKETNELRSKLKTILREFEDSFDKLRDADGIDGRYFVEFDHFVRRMFVLDRLTSRSIILLGPDLSNRIESFELPSLSFNFSKFVKLAQTGHTIEELSKKLKIPLDETMDLVSRICWNNSIHINFVPSDIDILALTEGSLSLLLSTGNPLGVSIKTLQMIALLDGRTPLVDFIHDMNRADMQLIFVELGDLVSKGYVHRISIERRLILVHECVINKIINDCKGILGRARVVELIQAAIETTIRTHPWIARIRISEDLMVRMALAENMTNQDLDAIYDALGFVIDNLTNYLSADTKFEHLAIASKTAKKFCYERWAPFLSGIIG